MRDYSVGGPSNFGVSIARDLYSPPTPGRILMQNDTLMHAQKQRFSHKYKETLENEINFSVFCCVPVEKTKRLWGK